MSEIYEQYHCDVLVAGGGVGGAMAAVRAQAKGAHVVWLTGSGGASQRISSMNAVMGEGDWDTADGLFDDMYRAGGHLSRPDLLASVVDRTEGSVRYLADLGVPFALSQGKLARRQAAGSSHPWAVYTLGMAGADGVRILKDVFKNNDGSAGRIVRGGTAMSLSLADDGRVVGALCRRADEGDWVDVRAKTVVLATGGAGQLFDNTTNPRGSLGTGYALALEVGAQLVDMEFISYEPFVTSGPDRYKGQDLPTTVLRQGALLRNGLGEEFLDTASSPSKDVICRAMAREVAEGRGTASGSVLFDLTRMDPEVAAQYVQITQVLRPRHLTSLDAQVEVMPAQHFLMGGIRTDARCRSTVPGLFAVGEVAGGVHGAHRLAGCGGTEVVAAGAIAGEAAALEALDLSASSRPARVVSAAQASLLLPMSMPGAARKDFEAIRTTLGACCGIIRNEGDATRGRDLIRDVIGRHSGLNGNSFVLRSASVALTLVTSLLERAESRGDHYREDCPERDDRKWLKNIVTRLSSDGELEISHVPAGKPAVSMEISASAEGGLPA